MKQLLRKFSSRKVGWFLLATDSIVAFVVLALGHGHPAVGIGAAVGTAIVAVALFVTRPRYCMKLIDKDTIGDHLTLDEWEGRIFDGTVLPGEDFDWAFWATETHGSTLSCKNARPPWATHVVYFPK